MPSRADAVPSRASLSKRDDDDDDRSIDRSIDIDVDRTIDREGVIERPPPGFGRSRRTRA